MSVRRDARSERSDLQIRRHPEEVEMPASSGPDQLRYMADLILELRVLSDRAQCATLAGLLDVAYREAMLQSDRH